MVQCVWGRGSTEHGSGRLSSIIGETFLHHTDFNMLLKNYSDRWN
jgi:hypothetical protein